MRRRSFSRRSRDTHEIAPDEVLLDATNLPEFDRDQLEGRIAEPIAERAIGLFLLLALLLFAALSAQAFSLQVIGGEAFRQQSDTNRLTRALLFAPRGEVYDRNGEVLIGNETAEDGSPRRTYAHPGLAHLLGYVSYPQKDASGKYFETEMRGVAGVEEALDGALAGENGLLLVETDAKGEERSSGSVLRPVAGEDVTLSVDLRVNRIFTEEIGKLADSVPFSGGAGVLMDVKTGELIALASYPEYDPGVLASGEDRETIAGYANSSRRVYLNRAVSGVYTPGSIVKPLVLTAALSEGVVNANQGFVSTGRLVIPNPYHPENPSIFSDWKAHGFVDAVHAIAVSSNVYFYTVGGGFGEQEGLGIDRLSAWYRKFGLGEPTGVELSGEASGLVPTREWKESTYEGESWGIGDTYFTAIGQYAMQVTPLQAVRAIAAIANGGSLVAPSIRKGGSGEAPQDLALNSSVLATVHDGMEEAVRTGTAKGLNVPYVTLAAKTGTAELDFGKKFVNAWAVGYFPAEKPQYAFAVVMEKGPRGNLVGAVYVMRQVLDRMAREAPEYLGLPPLPKED